MSAHQAIPIEQFDTDLKSHYVEVSTSALGGRVLSCSDDFFVSRHNLIKPAPSISMKGQFGPNGALYDAWETRRHNPTYDWIIIRLAPHLSTLEYVDIDTSHFSGNEAPMSQVFALRLDEAAHANDQLKIGAKDARWTEVLPVVELGPNSRHIFKLGKEAEGWWSAVMVRMIPDGGMARFRAYGLPCPPTPLSPPSLSLAAPINLLDPLIGARIISCSDANFSPPGNLLLPTRGVDMSDGWETRRSQHNRGKYAPGQALHGMERCEWVIARLAGTGGAIEFVEVDTAFHPGNYPVGCLVEGILSDENTPTGEWTEIVPRQALGPHRQHYFAVKPSVAGKRFSHVRLKTFPDGGLKRLRIFGHPVTSPLPLPCSQIPALPLTVEAFKPFGSVIQGFSLPTSAPKGIEVSVANQGTAAKFHRMARLEPGARVSVERHEAGVDVRQGGEVLVEQLVKRRSGYIPMTSHGASVVVVTQSQADGSPDMESVRAFIVTPAQGIVFGADVWHNELTTVNASSEYAILEEPNVPLAMSHALAVPISVSIPPFTSDTRSAPFSSLPTTTTSTSPAVPDTGIGSITDKLSSALSSLTSVSSTTPIQPMSMSASSFAPFGSVIDLNAEYTTISHSYPEQSGAVTGISLFRATQKVGLERGKVFDIRLMERHPYTSQVFIPMGKGEWKDKSEESLPAGGAFLVIVAQDGPDDRPDPKTVQAFMMQGSMGLCYAPGAWHHPVLILDATLDLACIETQVSTGVKEEADPRDCELLEWKGEEVFGRVAVPV